MTEYELAYLNIEYVNTGIMMFTAYFSTVSAFLLVSYVAAHRLTRPMAAIVVGLFAWSCVMLANTMHLFIQDWFGVRHRIYDFARTGKGLTWHSASDALIPNYMAPIVPTTWIVIAVVAIYFFFHSRRHNRLATAQAATAVAPPAAAEPPATVSPAS